MTELAAGFAACQSAQTGRRWAILNWQSGARPTKNLQNPA
jgi:hypothetical protein